MIDTYRSVRDFEAALCGYTGSRYAVTTTSCTMALLLACAWFLRPTEDDMDRGGRVIPDIEIPRRSYVSVPMSIIHAGGHPVFRDEDWSGAYQLRPLPVWDCARRFTGGMFIAGQFQCVSFHWGKILGIQQGGAILHDSEEADPWLRRARFDGRTEGVHPKNDSFPMVGWHAYMSPETAAAGLIRLAMLPRNNEDLPLDDYPDLSQLEFVK